MSNGIKLELGVILKNGYLKTDNCPTEIPDGEYLVKRSVLMDEVSYGDRVLVQWIDDSTPLITAAVEVGSSLAEYIDEYDEDEDDEYEEDEVPEDVD